MFRPCIDLHNGKVKQIVGGTLTDSGKDLIENFVSDQDASYYAKIFQQDGLRGGHVILLGSGNEGAALRAIRAYPLGLQVGGGINTDNATTYLESGASHVIVTSFVFNNGRINFENLKKLVQITTKERLVIDLSCRSKAGKYFVVTDRWQKFTDYEITPDHLGELEAYCDEFLVHGVDVEGKQAGIDQALVEHLAAHTQIPVTYAGGIRSFEDIETIKKLGNNRIHYTVGSALDIFGGPLKYVEVVQYSKSL